MYGYAISRFLAGMGGIGGFVTAFVLAVEHAGSRFTMLIGVAIMIPFALGEASLGLAAYLVRDWKLLQIITHLPLLGRRRSNVGSVDSVQYQGSSSCTGWCPSLPGG